MKRSSGLRRRTEPRRVCVRAVVLGLALLNGASASAAAQSTGATDSAVVWIYLDSAAARSEARPVPAAPALSHRARLGIGVLDGDRPLRPELVARIEAAGARVRHVSRWLGAVSAWADSAALRRLVAMPGIIAIQPVGRSTRPDPEATPPQPTARPDADSLPRPPPLEARSPFRLMAARSLDESDYGASLPPFGELGILTSHALGFTGRGVRIAILDTGFRPDHAAVQGLPVLGAWNFIDGDSVVTDRFGDPPGAADHGTAVWSLVGANLPGTLVGPAYEAEYILAKVDEFGQQPTADEDRWVAGLEWAVDSLGAQLVLSARGFRFFEDGFAYGPDELDGRTAASTLAAEEAARRGVVVVAMVGNGGPGQRTLVAPADAPSVIAVGAVDSLGQALPFSAAGPTADGRIKPDLVARGIGLAVASAVTSTAYRTMVGTDASAALIGGGAALFVQAWPELGPDAVRRALTLAGSRGATPGGTRGFGVPDVASAILFPDGIQLGPVTGTTLNGTLGNLAPLFTWDVPRVHPVAGPVTYRLELATDSAFGSVIHRDSVVDEMSIRLARPLIETPELWWRIVARTADGFERRTQPDGPYSVPAWVQLNSLNPTAGIYIQVERPDLRWSAIAASPPVGPLTFDVQVISAETEQVIQEVLGTTETVVTVPAPLAYNQPYLWRVVARSPLGVADTVVSTAPFVVTSRTRPPATQLYQNFPNPFPRPALDPEGTRIWFDLESRTLVELAVFDLRGRLVRQLIPARGCARVTLGPGLYGREGAEGDGRCVLTRWDGRDDAGRTVARGVYLLRLRAGSVEQTRRIVYLPQGS